MTDDTRDRGVPDGASREADPLEEMFAAARAVPEPPDGVPGALMARLLADAAERQPAAAESAGRAPAPQARATWARRGRRVAEWFFPADRAFGAPAIGGLAASMMVGLWVGLTPPVTVSALLPTQEAALIVADEFLVPFEVSLFEGRTGDE